MKPVATLAMLLAGWAGYGQQPRTLDCAATPDDQRCEALERVETEQPGRGQPADVPRIPVIRDRASVARPVERGLPAGERLAGHPSVETPAVSEPPTEFQQFVAQSTGRMFPLFGRDLFHGVPSTFAPADRVPVTPEYLLGPGDQLMVRGWGQIDLNVSPVVDRGGAVYIPQVGELNVAGLRFAQLQEYLKTAIGRVYRNFDLSVTMGQLRSIQVFVMGHARRPGVYTVSSLSTLVNAVFASGGPDSHGSMRHIRLARPDSETREFDFYNLLLDGDKTQDVHLLPGDVIYIPPVGPQVAVTGSVNTPAIYELGKGETLADALKLSGGLTPIAARRVAYIERIVGSSRRVLEEPLEAGKAESAIELRDGDIVKIMSITPRFENTVTLRGNVADPVRLPWHAGMRIRDLIPDREALLTRDYWQTRNRLVSSQQPTRPVVTEYGGERADGLEPQDITPVESEPSRSHLAIPVVSLQKGGHRPRAREAPGAESTGTTPEAIASKREESIVARNQIERNPLEVNWSYAVIERRDSRDLKTNLIPFNLGEAILDGDESANLPLEPGDVVTVFSTADLKVPQSEQTRYVHLEGEFVSAGVYSVRPGETLRELVKRAGGLTAQAYPFGSEFVRESTRLEQQQRLDDLVNSLERQAISSAANVRGTVISPEEAVAAQSQIEGQRVMVEKMRQVRATGRIVLDIDPRLPGVEGLPELPLEDSDVFTMPSRPGFVNVVGAVYNGTSFLYQEDKRSGDYLREAGGATRTGDAKHMFLIRADGSVISKSWSNGVFSGSFEGLRLNPGDTLVVPEQMNKTTFLKGLKDWSQVFAQFGLGVAAISVLH